MNKLASVPPDLLALFSSFREQDKRTFPPSCIYKNILTANKSHQLALTSGMKRFPLPSRNVSFHSVFLWACLSSSSIIIIISVPPLSSRPHVSPFCFCPPSVLLWFHPSITVLLPHSASRRLSWRTGEPCWHHHRPSEAFSSHCSATCLPEAHTRILWCICQ